MTWVRAPEVLFKLGLVAAAVWVVFTALSINPDARGIGTHEQLDLAPCGYLQSTGRPCITCGMTTSFAHMTRFQPVPAFRASPAGMLLCLVVMATPVWLLHSVWTGAPALRFFSWRGGRWIIPGAVTIVLLSWAFKIATHTP